MLNNLKMGLLGFCVEGDIEMTPQARGSLDTLSLQFTQREYKEKITAE